MFMNGGACCRHSGGGGGGTGGGCVRGQEVTPAGAPGLARVLSNLNLPGARRLIMHTRPM